jgi:hypothetical protein
MQIATAHLHRALVIDRPADLGHVEDAVLLHPSPAGTSLLDCGHLPLAGAALEAGLLA